MATKRVIAYFMHEEEERQAYDLLGNAEGTQSYVLGDIDDKEIAALERRGLIVQELEEQAEPRVFELFGEGTRGMLRGAMDSAAIDAGPPLAVDVPAYYQVTLRGPLLPQWKDQLAGAQAELRERVESNVYTVRMSHEQAGVVRELPFVSRVRGHDGGRQSPPLPVRAPAAPPLSDTRRMLVFDVRLHDAADRPALEGWLAERGVSLAGSGRRKIRLYLPEGSPLHAELARRPEVQSVDEYVEPELHNDRARVLIGLDNPGMPSGVTLDLTGAGQVVAVADTGIDESHPDLADRIHGVVALGRVNDPSDPNGHGTHVSGSIVGDGKASNGQIRGVAPGASLFFQSIMDARGRLGGLPVDLNDLFDEAYQQGARIHNNSWGADTRSRYTFNSIEVDEFVHEHRDMLIVISAGNEGVARDNLNADAGSVDWLSIGSPASSKNALTVGASRSDRTSGGYAALTYRDAWPDDYPDPPIADEHVSGEPESLAAFSSRGPCDDRRIKPDVVAPGTDIVSTKSSRAPLRNFWGAFPGGNGRYAYMGGTSMSAPIVAGCCALVREYYQDRRGHVASAALLKATLVNGTRRLTGGDATAAPAGSPNFHQGFGCIHLPSTVPNAAQPWMRLEFLDVVAGQGPAFTVSGERRRFVVDVGADRELRFCLAWTDLPARALQNNLNLFVQYTGDDQPKWIGNQDLPMSLRIPDPDNNVEVIRIPAAKAGRYLIQVAATNLLSASQDFALVVTGDLRSGIDPF